MQLGLPFGRQSPKDGARGPADAHLWHSRPPELPPTPPKVRPAPVPTRPGPTDSVTIEGHPVPVAFVRTRRARHYILRVKPDGGLRVTVPWHGSRAEALRFVGERHDWIARERSKRASEVTERVSWGEGTLVPFGGEEHALHTTALDARRVRITFGDQTFVISTERTAHLRQWVEAYLRRVATIDLPERLARLALQHGFEVKAVSIRNQRSRWGSCSASGRVSLNWRLIQFPAAVVDYVLIHELVHLRHMNHSRRFWNEVARLSPDYQAARAWLRTRQRKEGEQHHA